MWVSWLRTRDTLGSIAELIEKIRCSLWALDWTPRDYFVCTRCYQLNFRPRTYLPPSNSLDNRSRADTKTNFPYLEPPCDESYHIVIPDDFLIHRLSSQDLDYKVYPSITAGLELEVPCDRKRCVVFTSLSIYAFLLSAVGKPSATHNRPCFVVQIVAGRACAIWQKYVDSEVHINGHPSVRFLSHSGSAQKVSGGSSKDSTCGKRKKPYVLLRLQHGKSGNAATACQLLLIVDIIQVWAKRTHESASSPRINTLERRMKQQAIPCPQQSVDNNFRFTASTLDSPSPLPVPSTIAAQRPMYSHSLPSVPCDQSPIRRQSATQRCPSRAFVNSELHDYTWVLDRDPGDSDLLVIRINEKGQILRPTMVFASARWNNNRFHRILDDENPRFPKNVITKFTFDKCGSHHTFTSKYFRSGIQFCAIVPLDPTAYRLQCYFEEEEDRLFEPLETLLGISELLSNASDASKKWCKCHSEWNKFSTSIILCDNMKCKLGWYHKRCVGMDEDEDPDDEWLCRRCAKIPREKLDIAQDIDMPYGKLAEASSNRVQRAKTLNSAWENHNWPSRQEIKSMLDRICHNMDISKSSRKSISRKGKTWSIIHNYWAIRKNENPQSLIKARSRKLRLAYHEDIAEEQSASEGEDETSDEDSSSEDAGH